MSENRSIVGSALVPFRLVFFIWLIFTIEFTLGFNLSQFGIKPREPIGLIGILTAPLLHGSLRHIISNTFPLLFLGATLFYFYYPIAKAVFIRCYIFTGILVWCFAFNGYSTHIGASGLIYAIAGFLITIGIFRRDFYSILISLGIFILYGSLIYGIFPGRIGVSWESHLFGFLVGIYCSFVFRKKKE